jgi:hypothetical protein
MRADQLGAMKVSGAEIWLEIIVSQPKHYHMVDIVW